MLILIKESGERGLSKNALAEQIGVNPNSIQKWRTDYQKEGLSKLLTHGRTGFKPSVISTEQHQGLKDLLHNPENGIQGYSELKEWFEQHYKTSIPYTTLVGYCVRHFQTKIKVARKSHDKKDDNAVAAFKKTLVVS